MRKTYAIYVAKETVWEFPLGPFFPDTSDDELLRVAREQDWSSYTDAEEPAGWREFKAEIRTY